MNLFFANPWGLLALLGIPAVVLIHLLRRKSRVIKTSTLFLVEGVLKSREGGRRIQTLRTSLPFWIQIAIVLILSLVLAAPRWVQPGSLLKVAIVIDSSASMAAFQEAAIKALSDSLKKAAGLAGNLEIRVVASNGDLMAKGTDPEEIVQKVSESWKPQLGSHDHGEALRLARLVAGPKGQVVFLTDHLPISEEEGVHWIACGTKRENAGFLAGQALGNRWTAWIKNFSDETASLTWRASADSEWNPLTMKPGSHVEISGEFAGGNVTLELKSDALLIDNFLPLLKPVAKPLSISAGQSPLMERILRIAEPTTQGPPDLTLATYDPLSPVLPEGPAMLFLQDPAGKTLKPLPGMAVSENHPLMTDLDWRGLIVRDSFQVPFKPHDAPLLWVGERPVIFLRNAGGAPQLIFNFDVASSNASQLPAFALLLHRFLEERRSEKPAFAAANVTTGETLPLPGRERAPLVPGFFTIPGKDGTPRFEGAAQFGDARESNLLEATSGELDSAQSESIRLFNAEGQRFDSLWLLLLGLLMIWNWWLTGSLPSQKIAQTVPRPNI